MSTAPSTTSLGARWRGRAPAGRRGAVAVEFAVVASLFLALVLFCCFLGFRMYVQVALDQAASRAARLLAVDSTHALSRDKEIFQSAALCPLLRAYLDCARVGVSLWSVSDYQSGSEPPGGEPFIAGQGGGLMLLRLSYRLPSFSWPVPGGPPGAATRTDGVVVAALFPYQNEY